MTLLAPHQIDPAEVTIEAVQHLAVQARRTADSLMSMSDRIDRLAEAMELSFRPRDVR